MNLVDLAVLVIVVLSAIFAVARGFVREVLALVAWAGAALITAYGFGAATGFAARFVTTPLLAELLAGAALFLGSLIILTLLTGYAARLAEGSVLTPLDRSLGLAFGVARGLLLVSIAYFVIDITLPPNDRPRWLSNAKSEPLLAQGAAIIRGMLPASLQLKRAAAADEADRALGQAKAAQDAMGALATPAVPIPPKTQEPPAPSYKPADQRELNRLIDNAH